jgi:competence protein ComEA
VKEVLQRRITLSRLLLGLMVVPAVGIVLWLFFVKAPPGNAVLIEEGSEAEIAGDTLSATKVPAPTAQTVLFVAATQLATARSLLQTPAAPTIETIVVYVSGAVINPGLYSLPAGSRVGDAVAKAGGLRPDADMEQINLAARISDEEHILVPEKGATRVPVTPSSPRQPTAQHATPVATNQLSTTAKININTATATELERLPGIGPSLAAPIIAYREENGPFLAIEDLMLVPGIKEGIMSNIRSLITVGR